MGKMMYEIPHGSVITFSCRPSQAKERGGQKWVQAVVEKKNKSTVGAVEIVGSPKPGTRWKVSPGCVISVKGLEPGQSPEGVVPTPKMVPMMVREDLLGKVVEFYMELEKSA